MRTRAAVIREPGQPWEITELELDEPGPGEVRIRFVAAGMCHSDEHLRTGDSTGLYDIPRLLRLYRAGQLKLEELITRRYALDEINQGYADLDDGQLIRGVIIH